MIARAKENSHFDNQNKRLISFLFLAVFEGKLKHFLHVSIELGLHHLNFERGRWVILEEK